MHQGQQDKTIKKGIRSPVQLSFNVYHCYMYTIIFFNIIFRNVSVMGSTKLLCWHCARIEERRISSLNGTNRKYITVLGNYRLKELHSGY